MRVPERPPSFDDLWAEALRAGRLPTIFETPPPEGGSQERYWHWDKLRFRPPPTGLTPNEWWLRTKLARRSLYHSLPLKDSAGRAFQFAPVDAVSRQLHLIDFGVGGSIQMPEQITTPETKDRYLVRSLMEEAITSSQLEGATTTRLVAKEMIRTGRRPRDKSERMILNNYRTMQRIGILRDSPLTIDLILEIHRLITADTLDDSSAAGRLRRADEQIQVVDAYETVLHVPPRANELPSRIQDMCDFANGKTPNRFVHPAVRAIILHFWLAYDHPFVDGNGRVARALFYWSMLRQKYWLCEFISISEVIRRADISYGRAFLYTETDDNDLTYFILHQLDVVHRAIEELHRFIQAETKRLRALRVRLRQLDRLNHRQRTLVEHALRHPDELYTIEGHQVSHNVVYETARTDLQNLEKRGLLMSRKLGRTYMFEPAPDLERRLAEAT